MSKKYKEAMDQIAASDELKAKIIAEMMQTAKNPPKISRRPKRRSIQQCIGYAACFCLCVTAVLAGVPLRSNEDAPPIPTQSEAASPTPLAASAPPSSSAPTVAVPTTKPDTRLIQPTVSPATPVRSQGTVKSLPVPKSGTAVKSVIPTRIPQRKPTAATLSPQRPEEQTTQTTAPNQPQQTVSESTERQAPQQTEAPPAMAAPSLSEAAVGTSNIMADSASNATESAQDSNFYLSSSGVGGSSFAKLSPIEQVKQQAGYAFKYPQYVPNQYELTQAQLSENGTIEIDYESDTDKLTYRTERGANQLQNKSDAAESEEIKDHSVTLSRSESSDRYYGAEWSDENSYALNSSNGLSKDTITKIIENVDYPQDDQADFADTESDEITE